MEYDFAIKQNELLTNNMNEFQKYVKSKKPEQKKKKKKRSQNT